MRTSNLLLTQIPFYISLFLALFHCGIHYLVASLAHLHLLFLKHIYISILRVCNQDTPYILAYATVVSIALEHKLFCRKKKKVKIFFRASHGRIGATRLYALSASMHVHYTFGLHTSSTPPSIFLDPPLVFDQDMILAVIIIMPISIQITFSEIKFEECVDM